MEDLRGKTLLCTDVTVRGSVDGYVSDLAKAMVDRGGEVMVALEETTTSALRRLPERPATSMRSLPLHQSHDPTRLRRAADLLTGVRPKRAHLVCGSPRSGLAFRERVIARVIPLAITEQQVRQEPGLSPEQLARIRASYRDARAVIFVSTGNAETMARLVDLTLVRQHIIPTGVDVAAIQPRARHAREQQARDQQRRLAEGPRPMTGAPRRLLSLSRFSPEKGLEWLIRAVREIPADVVGELNLFGAGTQREQLQQLVKELDLTDGSPCTTGATTGLNCSDSTTCSCCPSLDEGMSYALLEAMAAGVPVLASDAPGNIEALDDGAAGTAVPRGDVPALTAAITGCLHDSERIARLAAAAERRIRAKFDRSEQMRRTLAVWTEGSPAMA